MTEEVKEVEMERKLSDEEFLKVLQSQQAARYQTLLENLSARLRVAQEQIDKIKNQGRDLETLIKKADMVDRLCRTLCDNRAAFFGDGSAQLSRESAQYVTSVDQTLHTANTILARFLEEISGMQ